MSCEPKHMSRSVDSGKGGGPGSGPAAFASAKKVDSSKPGKEMAWKGAKVTTQAQEKIHPLDF